VWTRRPYGTMNIFRILGRRINGQLRMRSVGSCMANRSDLNSGFVALGQHSDPAAQDAQLKCTCSHAPRLRLDLDPHG
jgi:hypothetical protein